MSEKFEYRSTPIYELEIPPTFDEKSPISEIKEITPLETYPVYDELRDAPIVLAEPIPNTECLTAKVFTIKAKGKELVRLPTAPRELTTFVTDTTGHVAYISTRSSSQSTEAILSRTDLVEVVGTQYFSGWSKKPVLYLSDPKSIPFDGVQGRHAAAISVKGSWPSRDVQFTDSRNDRVFEWRYRKNAKDIYGKPVKVMALVMHEQDSEGKMQENVLATMVRGRDTKTPGTGRFAAGNGGQLVILGHATQYFEEELIVATCLLMLKKEIERRRAHQAIVTAVLIF